VIIQITLARLATEFIDRQQLNKSTRYSYESTLIPFLLEYGRYPAETINRQQILDYLNSLNHLSPSTYNRHQATIQALFNFGVEQEYLTYNPIAKLKRHKVDTPKITYLTPEQLAQLYRLVADDQRMHALIRLLHQTGARIGEILALDLEQINLVERKFQVVSSNKQRWYSYREDTADILETYIKYSRHSGSPALFTAQQPFTAKVTRLSYRRVHKCWTDLTAQNPILSGCRIDDLRDTFAIENIDSTSIE
jgi:integrase/recombinase XerD